MGKIICLMGKSSTGKDTIYKHLQDYFGADRVLPVMIELDDGARLQRALNRERRQELQRVLSTTIWNSAWSTSGST